ncbi:MAG: hypothetical protein DYG89_47400 [Caldilinea sp. CFX5]|nr:hypothetical protein [Caldilinea sp. CFX5]
MLGQAELVQVREYVIKILPELLRTEPEIGTTIEGILAQHFPRRDELARMLDEVRDFRSETNQHFEQIDGRFEQVDGRFEQVDGRFEQVDDRFEQIDDRFEQIDGRFEQIDGRFEQIDGRFEQIDGRFEQVDSRLDQVDKRFDNIDRSLLLLKREQIQLKSGQESMRKQMEGMEAWVSFINGIVRNEKGSSLEDVAAAALRYKLQNPDIVAENVRLRQKLVDYEGVVFPKGFVTEVDIVAENGDLLVFEVKSTGRVSDVSMFALKVNLVRSQNPYKRVHGLFIAPAASVEIQEECATYGLQLLK